MSARLSLRVIPPVPDSLQRLGVKPAETEVRVLRYDRRFLVVQAPGLSADATDDLRKCFDITTGYNTVVANFQFDVHLLRVEPVHTSVWDRIEAEDAPRTLNWKNLSRALYREKLHLKAQVQRLQMELVARTGEPASMDVTKSMYVPREDDTDVYIEEGPQDELDDDYSGI